MKILYVEDELSRNIPGIIRLFEKYLGKKKIRRLKELEEDESGYGAEPDEIKGIVEETNIVEVEYRFPARITQSGLSSGKVCAADHRQKSG
ncbi:hypothetical protein [Desulfonema magnum]|uniref:hypothetical protein n=1 Tax=Desulfonema magnum TaxID=45655 RepID=UPI001A9BD7C6|nr:hypothetical protein [Desulfonema magnum]